MNGHIVLLGDSIFDNAAYVTDGPSVIEHVRGTLPAGWGATLAAVDGAVMSSVEYQLDEIPDTATHLFLSIGGNDALKIAGVIRTEPADSYDMALAGMARIRDEFSHSYRQMLDRVASRRLPLDVCTIYDAVPGLRPADTAGLSVLNEVVIRHVFSARATLIDLRLICNEPTDYSAISPIEPSASGGGKIADAIHRALFALDGGCRVIA